MLLLHSVVALAQHDRTRPRPKPRPIDPQQSHPLLRLSLPLPLSSSLQRRRHVNLPYCHSQRWHRYPRHRLRVEPSRSPHIPRSSLHSPRRRVGTAWFNAPETDAGGVNRPLVEAVKTALKAGYTHLDNGAFGVTLSAPHELMQGCASS